MMVCASRNTVPAVICCGRLGDVCAAIPIAHQLAYETGTPTPFIVSREYAPLLEACSYIEPIIVDEPFHRIGRVTRRFAPKHKRIHVAQIYSTDDLIPPRVTDSFVTDAWHRAGMLEKFGLPLVFDRRDAKRELSLKADMGLLSPEPYIVVHAGGISSPYPHRHELLKALHDVPARVIDITCLQCAKPQDLLAVLEGASCAILADSFPLHLSFALPNLPVIALQTDKPDNWFGAPSRPNWVASYRYGESLSQLHQIAYAAAFQVCVKKPATFEFPAGCYNASLLDYKGHRLYTWRYHHKGNWETRLTGCQSVVGATEGKQKPILLPPEYDACSHEDARLFLYRGKPHISLTLSKCEGAKPTMRTAKCVVVYGELQLGQKAWKVANIKRVRYGANDWSAFEKNWVFWSQDERLFCLYASEPQQVVIEVQGEEVVAEHKSPAMPCAFGTMRGDAIVQGDGELTRVFHTLQRFPSGKFRYFLGCSRMEATPPFRTTFVSPVPFLAGDERRPKTLKHSKPNVAFTCGMIRDGSDFVIPVSRDDDSTVLTRFSERQLGI
jgi:hypothetical protein